MLSVHEKTNRGIIDLKDYQTEYILVKSKKILTFKFVEYLRYGIKEIYKAYLINRKLLFIR